MTLGNHLQSITMRPALCVLALASIVATPASAQRRPPPPIPEVLDMIREGEVGGGMAWAHRIMADSTRSPQEIEAFVDHLIGIAVAEDARSEAGGSEATLAVVGILGAGGTGIYGRMYAQAERKLLALYEAIDDPGGRTAVLSRLTRMSLPPARVRQILRNALMDENASAHSAVGFLGDMGPEGMAVLEDVYRNHLDDVRNELARKQLEVLAYHGGWGGGG